MKKRTASVPKTPKSTADKSDRPQKGRTVEPPAKIAAPESPQPKSRVVSKEKSPPKVVAPKVPAAEPAKKKIAVPPILLEKETPVPTSASGKVASQESGPTKVPQAVETAKITDFKKPVTSESKSSLPTAPAIRPAETRKPKFYVPPILLEKDEPVAPAASGPGEKFSLGAKPPPQSFSGGELPTSYGTKKLFLTARDPHWLYANWDLTPAQQKELNADSADGHLILRVYAGKIEGHPAYEIHVHPDSRHWFAHVERAGSSYTAELGYYSDVGKWSRVAASSSTLTPPDTTSPNSVAEFATIPFEFPFAKLMQTIEEAVRDNAPLAVTIEELRRHGHPDLPRFTSSGVSSVAPAPSGGLAPAPGSNPLRVWTPEQEKALARVINIDHTRRIWMGSLEITELIRRRLAHEVSSPTTAFGPQSLLGPSAPLNMSSPGLNAAQKEKGFWFNVNAELIIYGATEPNAKVTLGGHEIKLRPDGTFSFRFALPDGQYEMPAVAVSADGTDARGAELKFSRATEYRGDVGATPQDPGLKPPQPENV